MLKVDKMDKSEHYIKAAHLAIRSVFPYYQPEFIKMKARKREVLELRQIFIWILRQKTSLSLQKIGQYAVAVTIQQRFTRLGLWMT